MSKDFKSLLRKKGQEKVNTISNSIENRDMTKQDINVESLKKLGKSIENVPLVKLSSAPSEWNFFPQISDNMQMEMVVSILNDGLYNPIIVWKRTEDDYMILSGHNRVEAYRQIKDMYAKDNDISMNYSSIPSIVYGPNEIDNLKAQQIIIDTNYIQREDNKRLLPTIVQKRVNIMKSNKDFTGDIYKEVSEALNLSKTKVAEDYIIATSVIPEFTNLYFGALDIDGNMIYGSQKLSKKSLLKISMFDKDIQKWIFTKYGGVLNNKLLLSLSKNDNNGNVKENIEIKFEEPQMSVIVKHVPKIYKEELDILIDKVINDFKSSKR